MISANAGLAGPLRSPIRFGLAVSAACLFVGCGIVEPDTTPKGPTVWISGRVESRAGTPVPDAPVGVWLRPMCTFCWDTFGEELTTDINGLFSTSYQYPDEFEASELCSGDRRTELGVRSRAPGLEDVRVYAALCSLPGGPLHPEIVLVLN